MDLKPYGWIDEEGKQHGLIYTMNHEIGARSGLAFTNTIMPFKRMAELLKLESVDLISSQPHKEILAAGEKLAVQHLVNVIVVTKKDSGIKTLSDLKNTHLLYHDLASYSKLEGVPESITYVPNYEQMLKMLHHRPNYDAGVVSEPAFYYFAKQIGLTPEDFGDLITLESGLEQWIIVRKGMNQDLKDSLKSVVTNIYQDQLYEQLLEDLK
ncbi:substrate-binding periplasmic protein [Vibrio hannami]|uniref:substrate-binding periplasmic protein n=1 Tax=Vibrio hannami TaxID=2717094 RepID=UPI0030CA49CB